MLAMSKSKTTNAPPSASATVPAQPEARDREAVAHERPHLSQIVMGLIDARVSRVDFFDTEAGQELLESYRFPHPGRRAATKTEQARQS